MFKGALKLSAKNKQAENPTYRDHLKLAYEKAGKPERTEEHRSAWWSL